MQSLAPADAARMLQDGATLVDIREPDEFARAHVAGARNLPLSGLATSQLAVPPGQAVLFQCRSGGRTEANAAALAAKAGDHAAFLVAGGLEAWQRAGLPVTEDRRQPIEIMRQVQIAAGILVLLGVVLGALVSPVFYGLSGFVGAGLIFAGVSGVCAVANLLRAMPWNRSSVTA
jgi:rhodanese-related sulfurtransferase